jgi:hypothetical protein
VVARRHGVQHGVAASRASQICRRLLLYAIPLDDALAMQIGQMLRAKSRPVAGRRAGMSVRQGLAAPER